MEKICKNCDKPRDESEFHKSTRLADGLQTHCKDCARLLLKQWRQENKEKYRQQARVYTKTPEQKKKGNERSKRWRDKNPDKVELARKKFYSENPERNMVYDAKKRAKKRDVPFTITHKDITIPEYCPALGIKLERGIGQLTDASPTLDCIFPEKGYIPGNIAVISHRANRIKSDATLEELNKVYDWLRKT